MVRTLKRPLIQVARRLQERSVLEAKSISFDPIFPFSRVHDFIYILKMFQVLEFHDDSGISIGIIPASWYIEANGESYWPPVRNPNTFVKALKSPQDSWQRCRARILKSYSTCEEASKNLSKHELQSDVTSESDEESSQKHKRVSRPPERFSYGVKDKSSKLGDFPKLCLAPYSGTTNEDSNQIQSPDSESNIEVNGNGASNGRNTSTPSDEIIYSSGAQLLPSDLNADGMIPNVENDNVESRLPQDETTPTCKKTKSQMLDRNQLLQPCQLTRRFNESPESSHFDENDFNEDFTRQQATPIELLRSLVQDVKMIKTFMINLDKKVTRLSSGEGLDKGGTEFTLPDQFTDLEAFLAFDKSIENLDKDVKLKLMLCGGNSVGETVGRMLKKIMSDALAKNFSLWGKRDNINFSETNLYRVVKYIVLRKPSLGGDEKSIEHAVSEWFRHASDRANPRPKKSLQHPHVS
ncbi:hypothetical protein Fcan01_15861 [Folsomia candida]|uniref:DUF4806 domain-containing protein n=1 Tax=Folsomia candida TaxID=158441 RepID=A0A226DWH4_FOLCA|nr:hypothetical protein Fcan01_15861 [Folsomia candida]